jgi:PIN domain nuclease of toxin-antitoxin system
VDYLLDTHILIWRLTDPKKLSANIQKIFQEDHQWYIPCIVILETSYLVDVGRIKIDLIDLIRTMEEDPNMHFLAYNEVVMGHSLRLTGNRDPFDRIILAHALSGPYPILTKDRWMKETAPHLVID